MALAPNVQSYPDVSNNGGYMAIKTVLIIAAKSLLNNRLSGKENIHTVAAMVKATRLGLIGQIEKIQSLHTRRRTVVVAEYQARLSEYDAWIAVYGDAIDSGKI
jgi:hypothetical protein